MKRDPIPCPMCGRLFRPNCRQIAACSTTCIEARRKAEGVGVNGILRLPVWNPGLDTLTRASKGVA